MADRIDADDCAADGDPRAVVLWGDVCWAEGGRHGGRTGSVECELHLLTGSNGGQNWLRRLSGSWGPKGGTSLRWCGLCRRRMTRRKNGRCCLLVASIGCIEWRTELTQTTKRYIGTRERQVCAVMWAVPRVDDVVCEFRRFATSNGWAEGYYSAAHGELTAAIVNSERRNSTSSSSALHQLHAHTELSWQMEW